MQESQLLCPAAGCAKRTLDALGLHKLNRVVEHECTPSILSLIHIYACAKAGPVLMEPIMKLEVVTPEENMGDVIGDLNKRRGQVEGC